MGANQSKLSSTGFDYVVAVTQDSINSVLKQYLWRSGLPEVVLCYVYDSHTQPQPIDFAKFLKLANKVDPFCVADKTAPSDPRVQALTKARFAFAIKAKLGLPPGIRPDKLPPIIALKPGQSDVTYTLLFAEFVAAEIIYGPENAWFKQAQPSGTSWTFSGTVDLNFQSADFAKLPAAVRERLRGLGDPSTFSVQQLYYDLNSSNLQQAFEFNQVPSNNILNAFMTADFVNTYWKALKISGGTILGYGVKLVNSPSFLTVTDLNHFVPQPVGGAGPPLMLNYLCATNNHQLPGTASAGFGWNWLDQGEGTQYHGVAAINRGRVANYLNASLAAQFSAHCYKASVGLGYHQVQQGRLPPHVIIDWSWNMAAGQVPQASYPDSGSTILKCHHESGDKKYQDYDLMHWGGGPYNIELKTTFDATVSVQGSQMVIVQHLIIWMDVRSQSNDASGNIVDMMVTDTFSIGVDDKGKVKFSTPSATANPPTSVTVHKSQTPGSNGFMNFFDPINSVINDVAQWSKLPSTSLADVNLSSMQNFIFPGGASFIPSDAVFSAGQDLVSHFTYANPS